MNVNRSDKSGIRYMYYVGIALIVIGIIAAIGILVSFDWKQYDLVKNYSYNKELEGVATLELITVWVKAGATMVSVSLAGLLLIALEQIAHTLKSIQLKGVKRIE